MSSSAGIIIIGDEIYLEDKDTNINWIANELNEMGIKLKEARVIKMKKNIVDTVLEFSTYVFTSGGIGPRMMT